MPKPLGIATLRSTARAISADLPDKDDPPPEFWDSFFDRRVFTIADCLEFFEIPHDEADEDDDAPSHVPFVLREMQAKLLAKVEARWAQKRAARAVVLKGRRYGMTRLFLGLGLERILRCPGYEVTLIAQDDPSAETHFAGVREMFDQIPKWALRYKGLTVVKGTAHEIRLRHGRFKTSVFRVVTAKRRALGRGWKNNLLIVTEFPQWPPEAKKDLSGILASCKNKRGNATIFESTARGYEEFHRRWKDATAGTGGYFAFFVPAWKHPGARLGFDSPEVEAAFRATIGQESAWGGAEESALWSRLVYIEKWPERDALEHLHDRRIKIVDECDASVDVYKREYPNSPEEAFQGTGRPVFPIAVINALLPVAQEREETAMRGKLIQRGTSVVFQAETSRALQPWTLFEMPTPGEAYCFGSDVASGYEFMAGANGMEADYSTCKMKHVVTGRTVARLHAHLFPRELAFEILKGSVLYGGAQGFIERNMDGGTVIAALEDLEIGTVVGTDIMLGGWRIVRSDAGKTRQYEFGFKTKKDTKQRLVDEVQAFLRDAGPRGPDAKATSCPIDVRTLLEMQKFVRLLPRNALKSATGPVPMGADDGHDDLVIDEGLALLARQDILVDGVPMPRQSARPTDFYFMQRDREWAEGFRKAGAAEKPPYDPMLGKEF